MINFINTTDRICVNCRSSYKARELRVLGMTNPLVLGDGKCPCCVKKLLEEKTIKENKQMELVLSNKRELWRKTCGIPLRFMDSRFKNFINQRTPSLARAYSDCVDYAVKFPFRGYQNYRSLILYSHKVWGVGKTHLVASIAHMILDKWQGETNYCPIRFISEPNLFIRIRNTFSQNSKESEADVYRELTTTPLLIIDDMGKEEVSDSRFVQRVWFTIINGRYDNLLPMVITANLDYISLAKHLGGDRNNVASFDRLSEMTNNVFREIIAESYRTLNNRVAKNEQSKH